MGAPTPRILGSILRCLYLGKVTCGARLRLHDIFSLLVLSREYGNKSYRDYIRSLFAYTLLKSIRFLQEPEYLEWFAGILCLVLNY